MLMKPRELLDYLLSRSGDNPNSLSGKVNIPQSTIQRFLAGTAKQPRHDTLAPIARFYGIPVVALMNEKDAASAYAALTDSPGASGEKLGFPPLDKQTGIVTIPRYETGGSMGRGIVLHDQPGVIERLDVSQEWLEKNVRGFTSSKNLCVVTGFGDSMRPMYNPGDPLIVDAGVKRVDFDAVYFFRVGDEGFIKRLQRVPGKGLLAISENQAYRDWVIDPSMDMELFGRVLKVWRSEDF